MEYGKMLSIAICIWRKWQWNDMVESKGIVACTVHDVHHKVNWTSIHPSIHPIVCCFSLLYKSNTCRTATLFPRISFLCDKLIDDYREFNSREKNCISFHTELKMQPFGCFLRVAVFSCIQMEWSGLRTFIHLSDWCVFTHVHMQFATIRWIEKWINLEILD